MNRAERYPTVQQLELANRGIYTRCPKKTEEYKMVIITIYQLSTLH
jgi:hypothetical protein